MSGTTVSDLNAGNPRGFLLAKGIDGPVTPIDVPGTRGTGVSGINDRSHLVGTYSAP